MPDRIEFDETEEIIRVTASGTCTIQDWIQTKSRILELYEQTGVYRVLVDGRKLDTGPQIFEIYNFAKTWPHHIICTAIAHPDYDRVEKFFQLVCQNRANMVFLFYSEKEALDWLKKL